MESCSDLLENDYTGRGFKSLKEELFEMSYTLRQQMDRGLSSEEMRIAQALKQAVDAAEEALDRIYTNF